MAKKADGDERYIDTLERLHGRVSKFCPGNWQARFGSIVAAKGQTIVAGMDAEVAQYLAGLHNALPGLLHHIKTLEDRNDNEARRGRTR